ncbi:MAG: hypothetical protein QM791_06625 [Ferruginibacter sp.]
MTEKELSELTDEQLAEQWKKAKANNTTTAVLIGVMIGASVFGAVKKGFTFFTLLPLAVAAFFANAQKKNKAIEKEVKRRNLQ